MFNLLIFSKERRGDLPNDLEWFDSLAKEIASPRKKRKYRKFYA